MRQVLSGVGWERSLVPIAYGFAGLHAIDTRGEA